MSNTILEVNLGSDDDYHFDLIPDGTELEVTIKACYEGINKEDQKTLRPVMVSVDDPDGTQDIGAFPIVIPDASQATDKKAFAKTRQRFLAWAECFGIDYSMGLNVEALKGLKGRVIVSITDDPQQGRVNQVKQYVVGQK